MAMARDTMIWVVDDDPELRKMVGTYLIDQGYDVRSLCDVKQFEARLECQRPDLVVLDLMLPGDDGLTALRRLRDAGWWPWARLQSIRKASGISSAMWSIFPVPEKSLSLIGAGTTGPAWKR